MNFESMAEVYMKRLVNKYDLFYRQNLPGEELVGKYKRAKGESVTLPTIVSHLKHEITLWGSLHSTQKTLAGGVHGTTIPTPMPCTVSVEYFVIWV